MNIFRIKTVFFYSEWFLRLVLRLLQSSLRFIENLFKNKIMQNGPEAKNKFETRINKEKLNESENIKYLKSKIIIILINLKINIYRFGNI